MAVEPLIMTKTELPKDYLRYIELKGGNIPPWTLLSEESSKFAAESLTKAFPKRKDAYPFAIRADEEEYAVFERDAAGKIIVRIIQLDEGDSDEVNAEYPEFRDWVVAAAKDSHSFLGPSTGEDILRWNKRRS